MAPMNMHAFLPVEPAADLTPAAARSSVDAHPASYVLVALVALVVGLVLGSLSAPTPSSSRADWPPAATNPRALNP